MTKLFSVRIDSLDWKVPEQYDFQCESIKEVIDDLTTRIERAGTNLNEVNHLQIVINKI